MTRTKVAVINPDIDVGQKMKKMRTKNLMKILMKI
jgi:hypothetical protein